METSTYHIPVLWRETVESLNVKPNTIFVDGTVGGGGHTSLILKSNKSVKVIGVDRDNEALAFTSSRLKSYVKNGRLELVHANYKEIIDILTERDIKVDGVLLDFGVSSHQLDEAERGFSFRFDAALDMRMDTTQSCSAYDVINDYKEEDLVRMFSEYGEEKFSKRIAKKIVESRPIKTTFELKNVITSVVDKINPKESLNSLQRVFQATRIEVNNEFDDLFEFIVSLPSIVKSGGIISIITFHSLEDRIVKQAFKELTTGCICPPRFPQCVCGHTAKVKSITRKPIIATEEELKENPRARSAKLRVVEVI